MENTFSENRVNDVTWMTADSLSAFPGLIHAFTTRSGGVSKGIYSSLNLGFTRGDDESAVRENYSRLAAALGVKSESMVFSHQIHSDTVRRVSRADIKPDIAAQSDYYADALITDEKNLPLVIFIADCVPILFYCSDVKAIGSAHAGWRGTVADIAGKTVKALAENYRAKPGNIYAAIGESIGKCCFETGREVYDAVMALGLEKPEKFIVENGGGKFHIDLKGINRALLIREGVPEENIAVSGECTKCLCDKYWSHRATNGMRGTQAAVIALK